MKSVVNDFLERDLIAYTLFGLTLMILVVDIAYIIGYSFWNTIGRVSLSQKPILLTGYVELDLFLLTTLSILSITILLYNHSLRLILFSLLLMALAFIVYVYNPIVLLSIYISLSFFILFDVFKRKVYALFLKGLLYSISSVGVLVIIYEVFKIVSGTSIGVLASVIGFFISFISILWFLSPILLLVALIVYIRNLLIKYAVAHNSFNENKDNRSNNRLSNRCRLYLLFGGVMLSFIISILPYIPTLNPKLIPVNTDWIYYYNWLTTMSKGKLFDVLIGYSDRSLYLLILFTIWFTTGINPKLLCIFHNIVLLPLYSLSLYYLAKEYFGEYTGLIALYLAPFTPHFISFVYGGFQANLLALSLVFITLSLLSILNDLKRIIIASIIFILILFIHTWTWTQYIIVIGFFLIYHTVKELFSGGLRDVLYKYRYLYLFVIVNVFAGFLKKYVFGLFSVSDVIYRSSSIGFLKLVHLQEYVDKLSFFFTIYTGGTYNNPLYYFIVLASANVFAPTMLFFSILLPLIAMIPPLEFNVITYRLLLNTPMTIIVAKGMKNYGIDVKIALYISLVSWGLWRILSIIPGLSL